MNLLSLYFVNYLVLQKQFKQSQMEAFNLVYFSRKLSSTQCFSPLGVPYCNQLAHWFSIACSDHYS